MRLLLDENVDFLFVVPLAARGHDVLHVSTDFRPATPDEDVLSFAVREERVLVTNDSDFGALIYEGRIAHSGIVHLRLYRLSFAAQLPLVLEAISLQESEPRRFTVVTPRGVR